MTPKQLLNKWCRPSGKPTPNELEFTEDLHELVRDERAAATLAERAVMTARLAKANKVLETVRAAQADQWGGFTNESSGHHETIDAAIDDISEDGS